MAEVVNGLEFELERACFDAKEEDSNEQISLASPTREENMCSGDQTIAYEARFSPKSKEVPKMKKRDNVSNHGPTRGWRWDSLWRRAKPSKVKTSPTPEISCQSFSLTEIQEATRNFSRLIGNDPFSNVYFGYIDDIVAVAFKRLNENAIHEFFTYIRMESQLQHINLVPLTGYCYDQRDVILVYDYMRNGRLYDHLHNNKGNDRLSWNQRLQICIGAAQGLNYLHTGTKHKIIHRNINSHDILLDDKWVAKITNLRCSKMVLASQSITYITTPLVGTIGYLDAEYTRTGWLTEKCDLFSFGVVLLESLSGRKALEPQEEEPYLYRWVKNRTIGQIIDPYLVGNISMDSISLVLGIAHKCLHSREFERPSMVDVFQGLKHALELQEKYNALIEEEGIIMLGEPQIYESNEQSRGVLDNSYDWLCETNICESNEQSGGGGGVLVDSDEQSGGGGVLDDSNEQSGGGGVLDDSDDWSFPR